MISNFENLPESRCLNCGKALDGAMGEAHPEPGDITLCIWCRHLMAFGDDLRLRALTDAEMIEVAGDEQLLLYSKVLKEMKNEQTD